MMCGIGSLLRWCLAVVPERAVVSLSGGLHAHIRPSRMPPSIGVDARPMFSSAWWTISFCARNCACGDPGVAQVF
ncbi:hypothetical protein BMG05_24540 [Mycobacterium malmoense]|nr:hypothetical protein BMG05_24540 [Mycobacterium malmoense]